MSPGNHLPKKPSMVRLDAKVWTEVHARDVHLGIFNHLSDDGDQHLRVLAERTDSWLLILTPLSTVAWQLSQFSCSQILQWRSTVPTVSGLWCVAMYYTFLQISPICHHCLSFWGGGSGHCYFSFCGAPLRHEPEWPSREAANASVALLRKRYCSE